MQLSCFSKTSIGYSHIKNGKPCQDFSAVYKDEERAIVAACDGHGGRVYIRSQFGSKYASESIINVFLELSPSDFYRYTDEEIAEKLRLQILCSWNNKVEKDFIENPVRRKECRLLSDNEVIQLKGNTAKAYGTTLNGAIVLGNKLVCASLGDGGVFLLAGGQIMPAFPDSGDEETVANVTYSMCQEDAYKYLQISVFDFSEIDGVLLCTDGLINPYRNLKNFNESFAQPVLKLAAKRQFCEIETFVERLGREIGIGDDVSLGLILKH